MSAIIEVKDDRSENVYYNFPDYPVYIQKRVLSHYPNYAAVSHWHDDVEFISVLSGEMQYNINGEVVKLDAGDGIFVNSRELHYGFSQECKECEFICVLFHPMLLCMNEHIEKTYVEPIISNEYFSYKVLCEREEWESRILAAVRQMYEVLSGAAPQLQIQSLFCGLWSILYEHAPGEPRETGKRNRQLSVLRDMVGYIQRNYREKISLEDIADVGHMCKSKCGELFRSYTGKTPFQYLTDYRLKKSIDLLNDTDLTIAEIGYEVGFSGASYYTETFRKYFGCSPREYRKHTG